MKVIMKTYICIPLALLALACTGLIAQAQSTGFNYQGYLTEGDGPATDLYEMSFGLFTTDTGGTAVDTIANPNVPVTNGLFSTTLHFDSVLFDGTDYWLEIGVRPGGSSSRGSKRWTCRTR